MTPELHTWLYPWDIHDLGVDAVAELLRLGEVDVVHVATSYHSLFATVPDNPRRRHVELTSSAIYHHPDPEVWDGCHVPPTVSPMVTEVGDALELARRLADAAGCEHSAWTVCLHDSTLGQRRPDLAVETLWGERVLTAPCLRHPVVRDVARRLVLDVGARADRVQLESACWSTLPHHRHAKLPAARPDVVVRLAEICFCERCRSAAAGAGLDVEALVRALRRHWEAAHTGGTALADDTALADVVAATPGLANYLRLRTDAVTALVGDLTAASPVPVEVLSFGDRDRTGVSLADLEATGAAVRVLAYGGPEQVAQQVAAESAAPDRPARLHVGLSLLPEHSPDAVALSRSARHALDAGAASLSTYHLGLATAQRRRWLADVAAARRPSAAGPGSAT